MENRPQITDLQRCSVGERNDTKVFVISGGQIDIWNRYARIPYYFYVYTLTIITMYSYRSYSYAYKAVSGDL